MALYCKEMITGYRWLRALCCGLLATVGYGPYVGMKILGGVSRTWSQTVRRL